MDTNFNNWSFGSNTFVIEIRKNAYKWKKNKIHLSYLPFMTSSMLPSMADAEKSENVKGENQSQNAGNLVTEDILNPESSEELKEEAEKLKEKANEYFKSN